LRVHRERFAAFSLLNLNSTKEKFEDRLKRADAFLRAQTELQLASEDRLYKQTLTAQLALDGLEGIQARIDREKAEVDALTEQCRNLRRAVEEAAVTAETARIKHVALLRARKKWEEVRRHYAGIVEVADGHQEEDLFDYTSLWNKSR
jgi:hypothetical protein